MSDDQTRLQEGIAYFEKMLKVMPGDRTTLEFLSVAYEQIGDEAKLRGALIQLAETLLKEGDQEPAEAIGSRLAAYPDPEAQAMARKVRETFHGPDIPAAALAAADQTAATGEEMPVARAILEAVKAEAALIRQLSNRGIVDPVAAEMVQKHLGGLPEATRPFLVSTLSILYRESTPMGEKAAAFVADSAGTPPIQLDAFFPSADLLKRLPENLVRVRGVVPFAKLGDLLLVAMLNPLDEAFRNEVARLAGGPCQFFLAHPRGAEEYLEKLYAQTERMV